VERAVNFDYYLLSLSWSPEYCSGPGGPRDKLQCGEGRRFGFVVHGLWPQAAGGNPQNCGPASKVPESIVNAMLPLMPSPGLIQHEWATHGTCSGLEVEPYFQEVQRAFASVTVPDDFKQPQAQVQVKPQEVKAKFAQANSSFPAEAFRLRCTGRYLSEVRVCLTTDLKGRGCEADVRENCSADSVILRPVR
jgi:ribonuclease T2